MIKFQSITEQRLNFAFNKVQEVIDAGEEYLLQDQKLFIPSKRKELRLKNKPSEIQKNYHQYVKSFAMLILNNGLVSALLFTQGKASKGDQKGKAYELIINHLTTWLKCQGLIGNIDEEGIKELYNNNSNKIRLATLEAIRFMEDLKRVADGRLFNVKQTKVEKL